jgi:hypothetical protein
MIQFGKSNALSEMGEKSKKKSSDTGNRTRGTWVKAIDVTDYTISDGLLILRPKFRIFN